jgi:ankyrin repeat protein
MEIPATDPRWGEAELPSTRSDYVGAPGRAHAAVRRSISVSSLRRSQSSPTQQRAAAEPEPAPRPEPEPELKLEQRSDNDEPQELAAEAEVAQQRLERLSALDGDELIEACLADKPLSVVRDLLDRGIPINYAHRATRRSVVASGVDRLAGATPLHACASGTASASGERGEVMKLLLERGGNTEARTAAPHGLTPFCCACKAGNTTCAALLQAAGCDVDASSYEGLTAREYAERSDHRPVLRLFSAWGTKEELNEELRHAARQGRRGSVSRLLGLGGDPATTGRSGGNALHLAVVTGDHVGVVESLLFGGAAPEGSASTGAAKQLLESKTADNLMTPFACACYYGRAKSVSAMLAAGCDVNALDSVGWTGKDWAEHMEQQAVLDVLPRESRCERPASRLDTLLPEPRRPDREKEAAALRIQSRLRGNAARREYAAETARREAAKASTAAHKEEQEARAAEAAAEAEWGDVTAAERELKRAELSGDETRIEAARQALERELAEAEEAQANADRERAEAEEAREAHEHAEATHASLKVASEVVLASVNGSSESDQPPESDHVLLQQLRHREADSSTRHEELAALREMLAEERSMRHAAEGRAEKAEALVAKLRAELEQRAESAASAAEMRAAEAERRATVAEERAARAQIAISVAEETAAAVTTSQLQQHDSSSSSARPSAYKTRPWSGSGGKGSPVWKEQQQQVLGGGVDSSTGVPSGVEWVGVNRRNLFG